MLKRIFSRFLFFIVLACSGCTADARLILNKEYRQIDEANGTKIKFSKDLAFISNMGHKYKARNGKALIETPLGVQPWEIVDKGVLKYNEDYYAIFDEKDFEDSAKFSKDLIGTWRPDRGSILTFRSDGSFGYSMYDWDLKYICSQNIIRVFQNYYQEWDDAFQEYYYKLENEILYLNGDAYLRY
jgi:hypothetical protein